MMRSTVISHAGLIIEAGHYLPDTLTAAGADTFVVGTLLARDTATLKLVAYVQGGAVNGNGIACAVLTIEAVSTGAEDLDIEPMFTGVLREDQIVLHDASTFGALERHQLRGVNMHTKAVRNLSVLDNT